jgi:hypothetical protein
MANETTFDEYDRAVELKQAKQKGLASRAADMAIKKALPEVAVAEKIGKVVGFDVMKWIKWSMLAGIVMQFIYIVGSFLLIFIIVAVIKESIGAFLTDPIGAIKTLWNVLNPGTVENPAPVFDIGGA